MKHRRSISPERSPENGIPVRSPPKRPGAIPMNITRARASPLPGTTRDRQRASAGHRVQPSIEVLSVSRRPAAAAAGDAGMANIMTTGEPGNSAPVYAIANGGGKLPPALACHAHLTVDRVQIADVNACQFAHAQAGTVQQLEDRAVAQYGRRRFFGIGFYQPAYIVLGQNGGQEGLRGRRAQRARRARRTTWTCYRRAPPKKRPNSEEAEPVAEAAPEQDEEEQEQPCRHEDDDHSQRHRSCDSRRIGRRRPSAAERSR